jgi:hypothetical protein
VVDSDTGQKSSRVTRIHVRQEEVAAQYRSHAGVDKRTEGRRTQKQNAANAVANAANEQVALAVRPWSVGIDAPHTVWADMRACLTWRRRKAIEHAPRQGSSNEGHAAAAEAIEDAEQLSVCRP